MNMNLQNLQGWLKVYFIYLLIAVGLDVIFIGQGLMYSFGFSWISTSLLGFGLIAFAAWALTQTGKPWVRFLHIALNGVSAIVLLPGAIGLQVGPVVGWIVVAPLSGVIHQILPYDMIQPIQFVITGSSAALAAAWTGYWAMSVRVRDVYLAPVPAPGAASPNVSSDAASETAPDAQQETAPPQNGYITEEDAARGQAHQSAQAPRPPTGGGPVKPGMSNLLRGCLIALGLLLVAGLIFVAMIITTLESWFG